MLDNASKYTYHPRSTSRRVASASNSLSHFTDHRSNDHPLASIHLELHSSQVDSSSSMIPFGTLDFDTA